MYAFTEKYKKLGRQNSADLKQNCQILTFQRAENSVPQLVQF